MGGHGKQEQLVGAKTTTMRAALFSVTLFALFSQFHAAGWPDKTGKCYTELKETTICIFLCDKKSHCLMDCYKTHDSGDCFAQKAAMTVVTVIFLIWLVIGLIIILIVASVILSRYCNRNRIVDASKEMLRHPCESLHQRIW